MVIIIDHPSEEYVKGSIFGLLFWALAQSIAQAQPATPLLVGSLRDQTGTPVAGARVSALDSAGATLASAASADDGTFALQTASVATVLVECDYCVSIVVHPQNAQPLAIIVHRFLAVMQTQPTQRDIAALPYAHAESLLSLAPYTVLNDSSTIVPGPYVSDRGLSAGGGLVFDRDVPVYDVTANESPFVSVPSRSAQSISLTDAGAAFRYGDHADAGIAAFDTQNSKRVALVSGGDDRLLQFASAPAPFTASAFLSSNPLETRQRVDASVSAFTADASLNAALFGERGSSAPDASSNLDVSFSALRLSVER
ncbi:MAG: carboxypeptidase regulatory-like domain-containing protein, partial [Candidatus Eremiobacteraeota bacterium]|nr:carboxypeptidase regulatory-like domain-containing protein [Candidatus Eremiobacteraeota bacterium]